jgi:alkaline phosphatase D
MSPIPAQVQWQVATDPGMTNVIRSGQTLALPEQAHSVHVHVLGLPPDAWFWYRFEAGGFGSPIGRTRTFPDPGTQPQRMRYVLASCQNYGDGFFSAYHNIALEPDIDFVVHVGDYIYEFGSGPVRSVIGSEPTTLAAYRNRHALYKLDPQLQAAHAAFPFIHTWDDHEVVDGYVGPFETDMTSSPAFLARRSAAYQAHYEHLPLSSSTAIAGAGSRLYRRFRFGDLAQFLALDTRSLRSNKVCPEGGGFAFAPLCEEAAAASRTFLGFEQEDWLARRLDRSSATWNFLAQGVMVMDLQLDLEALGIFVNLDAWSGYPTARGRLLQALSSSNARNPVVLTGDFHSSWVADLKLDSFSTTDPVLGTEFVGPAISTGPPGATPLAGLLPGIDETHHHVQFREIDSNGYVVFDVDANRCRAEYRVVANVLSPTASASTLAAFEIPDGGVVAAA